MRKIFTNALLAIAMAFTAQTASAQWQDLIGKVANTLQQKTTNSDNSVLSGIGSVITSKLIPNSMQIVGTWTYKGPAVMFTSDNALKSTASSVASKQIESKLQGYLNKVGMAPGKMTITFEKDSTFYVTRNEKKITTGTYHLSGNDVQLTFKNKKTPCKVTPQLDNGTLVVVMDATKLKTFFEGIGSKIPQLGTVTSLMKGMDGMLVGIRMTKK